VLLLPATWLMREFCPSFTAGGVTGYFTASLYALAAVASLSGVLARNFHAILRQSLAALDGKPSASLLERLTVTQTMLQKAKPGSARKVVMIKAGKQEYMMLMGNPYCIVTRRNGTSLGFVNIRELRMDISTGAQRADPVYGRGRQLNCVLGKEYSANLFGVQGYIEDQRFIKLLACFVGLGSSGAIYKGQAFMDDRSVRHYRQWQGA